MSFWCTVGVKISDMDCFKQSCKKHEITYTENQDKSFKQGGCAVAGTLKGPHTYETAYLIEKAGEKRLYVDTDPMYSPFTKKFGENGGVLMRDYSRNVVEKNISRSGGILTSVTEQPDGSIYLKAAVM